MRSDEKSVLSLSGLLRRLEYFVVVADELHLGRAAQRCQVSQPTLSHQIKVLEGELGAELLSRSSRGMSLTAPGKALQEEAPRLLQRTYSIRTRVMDAAAEYRRPVRVAFSRSGHALLQREMVADFRSRAGVPVSVESSWSERNIDLVREGQVDFAFVRPPVEATDLCLSVVGDVELVQLLPANGVAARGTEEQPDGDPPLIMWPRSQAPGLYDRILGFVQQERSAQVAWEEPDYINVAAAVASGAGVSYMDRGIAEWLSLSADLRLRSLGPTAPRTDVAVIWGVEQDQGLAEVFVAACRRVGDAMGTGRPDPARRAIGAPRREAEIPCPVPSGPAPARWAARASGAGGTARTPPHHAAPPLHATVMPAPEGKSA